jgi:hypothetical protein
VGNRAGWELAPVSGAFKASVGCRECERRGSRMSGAVSLKSWRLAATFLPVVEEGRINGVEVEAEEDDDDEIDE